MTDKYDPLAEEEAQAAAAEARRIGGKPTRDLEEDLPHDPAFDPVYEAGGGDAEGWEMAEEELIEHAVVLEPQVPVQPGRVVLLDDELAGRHRRGGRLALPAGLARRLGGRGEVPLGAVLGEPVPRHAG